MLNFIKNKPPQATRLEGTRGMEKGREGAFSGSVVFQPPTCPTRAEKFNHESNMDGGTQSYPSKTFFFLPTQITS